MKCVHCGFQLETADGRYDACRFCRKAYKLRCAACLEGRADHRAVAY